MSTPLAPAKPQGGGQISAPPTDEAVRAEALPAQRARRRKLMRQTELIERVKAYDPDADDQREDSATRAVTEEELLRALTSEAQRRAEPQPEPEADYEE